MSFAQDGDPVLCQKMLISWSRGVRNRSQSQLKTHWPTTKFLNSRTKLAQEKLYLEEEIRSDSGFERIIGKSAPLKHILDGGHRRSERIPRFLLLGRDRNGQGAHCARNSRPRRRKDRTFVKLIVPQIPTACWRAKLFGHERRVHRSHYAKNRAIGSSRPGHALPGRSWGHPIGIQPKLLRASRSANIERLGSTHTRKVNVRLVAATNRNLEKWLRTASFAVTCSTG